MRFIYPVELEEVSKGPPEDHCVLATFPDLPEANTFGKDRADALFSNCARRAGATGDESGAGAAQMRWPSGLGG